MERGRTQNAWTSLDALLNAGTLGSLSDGQLLDHFARDHDAAGQEAFRILVARHGAMVLGVCRSLVRDPHEAEDAFQATFLVLVRRAGSIRRRETIAPWLYGVARRVARRARIRSARRRRHEIAAAVDIAAPAGPVPDSSGAEQALHEEIGRLPDSLRAPLVLCCLEGQSYDLAASRLGVRESTLRGRLHRARRRLEARLKRRGLLAPLAARLAEPWDHAGPPLPASLIESTTQFAGRWSTVSGLLVGAAAVPESIAGLARGVLHAMLFQTARVCGLATIIAVGTIGTLVVAQQERGGANDPPQASRGVGAPIPKAPAAPPEPGPPRIDLGQQTQQIYEKLAAPIELELPGLMELGGFLKAVKLATTDATFTGLPFYVDPIGLSEANATMESDVVVYRSKGATLHDVLRETLRKLRLAFIVQDGFVMISSRQAIADERLERLETKVDQLLDAMERLEGRQRRSVRPRPSGMMTR